MKVDSNIVRAIEQFMTDGKLSCEDFARNAGVSNAAVTKWRKVGSGITTVRWKIVFPLLRKYLPKERIYIDDAGHEQYSSAAAKQSAYFFEPKYIPLMVPEFSLEQMSEYDDTLESITQLGSRFKAKLAEYRPKHKNKSSVFAIRLFDDKLAPVLPKYTTLFVCAGERPSSGGMAVTLPIKGKPFVGTYNRKGNKFEIVPICGTQKKVSGKVQDAKNIITWTYPVLYYEVVTFLDSEA